jgi:hypothetical protein
MMSEDDSILARANKLTSDLNRLAGLNQLEASTMVVNNNGNDGFASCPSNGNGSNVDCDNEIYSMSDNNCNSVSSNAVLSMSDLMEIVKRQQSLIVDLASAISMKNAATTTANISMATTATTKQMEDTAAIIKLQQQHHQQGGEEMTRSSNLHLLVSQLQQHHTIVVDNVQSEGDYITTNGKTKKKKTTTTNDDTKSVTMKDYWRVLIVTVGCAIILALAIGLGAHRQNTTSRHEEGPTIGGDGEFYGIVIFSVSAICCVCQKMGHVLAFVLLSCVFHSLPSSFSLTSLSLSLSLSSFYPHIG